MIENEQQYQITLTQRDKFLKALDTLDHPSASESLAQMGNHPLMIKIQRNAIASVIEEFNEQLAEYEASKKK